MTDIINYIRKVFNVARRHKNELGIDFNDMRYINEIIIHCSATKESIDFNVNDLRRWHKAQGWKDVQIVPEIPLLTIMNFLYVLNQRLVTLENVVVIPDGKGKMINVTDYYAMQAEAELKARAEAAAKEQEQEQIKE